MYDSKVKRTISRALSFTNFGRDIPSEHSIFAAAFLFLSSSLAETAAAIERSLVGDLFFVLFGCCISLMIVSSLVLYVSMYSIHLFFLHVVAEL